jgi:menaquinone-dependent protoporphyrinogen oxidase
MPKKILVAYATKYGSTREVAEAIAKTLETKTKNVELRPMNKVSSLTGVDAVIMGAPLYMFRWHKDAVQFLTKFVKPLSAIPVAVFALGPFHDAEEEWQEISKELDKELDKFPWLAPVSKKVFGGRFDPASLTFPYNLIPALKEMPATDIRDWKAIETWANEVYDLILNSN